MTDPLDDLNRAMARATPPPDPARKAATLARAKEIHGSLQGSAAAARPTPDRPTVWAAFRTGAGQMLSTLTSPRGMLAATTATAAVALFLVLPTLQDAQLPGTIPVVNEVPEAGRSTGQGTDTTQLSDAPEPEPMILAEEPMIVEREAAETTLASPPVPPAHASRPRAELRLQSEAPSPTAGAPRSFAVPIDDAREAATLPPETNTEAFANADPNPVQLVSENPVSTFSADVDTASYSVIRSSLTLGMLPPEQAVRIEEMINYFPYQNPAPAAGEAPFRPTVTVTDTPWNPDTQLLHIALQGQLPAIEDRPPLNLVFLIDTSGSMQDPNKLALLKQSLRLMLPELRPEDEIAIVTYAGSAGRVLDATPASDRRAIFAALDSLQAAGSTAGAEGLELAYDTAEAMAEDGEVTRVLLATDGDFNVGISDPEQLERFIARKRDSGAYLSVLGFGRGNLDDATMQALAQAGNGQAAYIDTLSEARKVLVDQLTGALFPIAEDVKIQVEFNPGTVAEYRLIGYETRSLRREDFNNDKVDAGEIGAGHAVTAIYEITPVGSPAQLSDPLRYATEPTEEASQGADEELAFLRLRYKDPGADTSQLIELPITQGMGTPDADTQFAAAIAGFGQLLTHASYIGDWGWDDAIRLAETAQGDDPFGYRREAVTLMRLAQSLSQ